MTLKRETDKQMFLFALVSPRHDRSGLEDRRVHVLRKQDSEFVVCSSTLSRHVLMCTQYPATPVGRRNHSQEPLDYLTDWTVLSLLLPCEFGV